jgi:hypothetical protein
MSLTTILAIVGAATSLVTAVGGLILAFAVLLPGTSTDDAATMAPVLRDQSRDLFR